MIDSIHDDKLAYLEEKAIQIREDIIETLVAAGSGHSAGPLGMADIFTCLYFHVLKHNPKKPALPERDRVVLSNGHICPVQYVTLAHAGYFPREELKTLRKINSRLQGHPHRKSLPGIETTSGPLGSGLSQAVGMALAARMDKKKHRIYCLTSDGEHQEGNHWEAVLLAGKEKLSNLTVVVDRNNIQIDGNTEDVMPLNPFKAKYEAFNWHVLSVDGHNIRAFADAINEAQAIHESPTAIIAHTTPGKGVGYMENDYKWHGAPPGVTDMPGEPPKKDQVKIALHDLRTLKQRIKSEHE